MNEIRLQSYALNAANYGVNNDKNKNDKEVESEKTAVSNYEQKNPEEVLNSLDLLGKQNIVGMTQTVNPANYLSEDRISDIESSMAQFEAGVESQMEAFENEFGGVVQFDNISDADKIAMAATSWAAMN